MHIGIAGTGKMGSAIARRLLGLGHPVAVWNRTPAGARAVVEFWGGGPEEDENSASLLRS